MAACAALSLRSLLGRGGAQDARAGENRAADPPDTKALQRADLGKATTRSVGRAKLVRMKPKQIQRLDGLFGYDSDTHVRADAR